MSDYSQITFFTPKDGLATGNPNKIIYGSDVDAELSAISTAITSKADVDGDAIGAGTPATEINVDNLKLDANKIISTDTDGDIELEPNGSGYVVITNVDVAAGEIDGTVIGGNSAAAGTFTTLNATTVDATNLEVTNLKAKDGTAAGSIANSTGVVTLASSVLTTTDINGGTVDGAVIGGATPAAITGTTLKANTSLELATGATVTAILDEDTMTSDSDTALATQQSIKAYVDAQVTAQDLDVTTDSGTIAIDLDSETLTVAGGTGLDTSATGNTVTVAIDSTVATLTGTQTLTNKTLTSPDINTPDIDGGTIDGATIATSDVTVGAGKTLDVSAGTLTLANDQISGDKIEGGTIGSVTITTADINGGTLDGVTIGGSSAGAGSFTTLTASGDVNFDSGTLFVDASADAVGIGTSSPGAKLHLESTAGNQLRIAYNSSFYWDIERDAASGALTFSDGATERMQLDGSGNLGLGVVPSAWSWRALQVGSFGGFFATNSAAYASYLGNNAYYNGANWVYLASSGAVHYELAGGDGAHKWYTAPSGTAGNAISFTQAMTLDASGRLGIGTSSPSQQLTVSNTSGGSSILIKTANTSGGNLLFGDPESDTSGRVGYSHLTNYMYFNTNGSERMRIDSSGNLLVGTTTISGVGGSSSPEGVVLDGNNAQITVGTSSDVCATFNRQTTDGAIVQFRKDGTTVGSIGIETTGFYVDGESGHTGLKFRGFDIIPRDNGSDVDGGVNLGASSARFGDLYLSGGVQLSNGGAVLSTSSAAKISMYGGATNRGGQIDFHGGLNSNGILVFRTGAGAGEQPEIARFDSSGNLFVGVTTQQGGGAHCIQAGTGVNALQIQNNGANPYGPYINFSAATPNNATNYFMYFTDPTATRAILRSNGGFANYQANDANLSDERVKTDIAPLGSMWDKFKALEIVTFKYKDQSHDDDNIGVIAQQVEAVAPEFVDNDGFGETPEGEEPLKAIYTADLYHAAIKALQEAMARIETLEAEVAALKGA